MRPGGFLRPGLGCCLATCLVGIGLTLPASAQTSPAPSPAPSPSETTSGTPSGPGAAEPNSVARPFGPGQPIEVTCDEPDGLLFVAKGNVDPGVRFPDPFVKVGRLPLPIELPPGVFTVLIESDRFPSASTVFEVRHQPVHVRVDAGSEDLRDLSTLTIAIGAVATLAGAVLEISGTGDGDVSKKRKMTIPLFITGGVSLAGGIALFAVSGSSVEHDGYVAQPTSSRFYGLTFATSF